MKKLIKSVRKERVLGFSQAEVLSDEEVKTISGAGTSCSGGKADDCAVNSL